MTDATRFRYSVSDRNGRIGASVRLRLTSAAWRVANAASRSAGSAPARIRSRDRRRYQVDRSSMNALERARGAERVEVARAAPRRPRRARPRATGSSGRGRATRRPRASIASSIPRAGVHDGQPRVGDEERVHVPQDEQLAARLVGGVPAEQDVVLGPGLREHPAHDVDAHPVGRLVELDRVAPALVHRPPVLAEHEGVAEDRLERLRPLEHRRHREHRVEPVAELAREALGDEVGREPLRPVVGVLAVVERARTARCRRRATGCRRP